jgi:hypothetical protein
VERSIDTFNAQFINRKYGRTGSNMIYDIHTKNIIDAIHLAKKEFIIENFNFGRKKKNELIFFFKPWCFTSKNFDDNASIVKLAFEKFREFKVEISGVLKLTGKRLEELEIMDKHYGVINKLSRCASKNLSEEEEEIIAETLGISNLKEYHILGGHECLAKFPKFDEYSLNDFWAQKKSKRLRSGFYYNSYEYENEKIILVNGFHPSQLSNYTHPDRQLIILLVHSDTSWEELKEDLIGNTYPERAVPNSIRGELFRNREAYGINQISISRNYVHLSAGPFEALFEIVNFLRDIEGLDFQIQNTNMHRLFLEQNLEPHELQNALKNPPKEIDSHLTDLFTITEEKDSLKAIEEYKKHFLNN